MSQESEPQSFPPPIFPGMPIPDGLGTEVTPEDQKRFSDQLRQEQQKRSLEAPKDTRPPVITGGLVDAIRQASGIAEPATQKDEISKLIEQADQDAPLSPEELQRIREIIYTTNRKKQANFELPVLEITEADRDTFCECVLSRKPYREKFVMMKGKLTIVLREKLKRETEAVYAQIEEDFRNGLIRSEASFVTRLQDYNLAAQLVSINEAPMPIMIPVSPEQGWSLADSVQKSILGTFSENTIFLLFSALTQFERKVKTMSEEVVKENFTQPAADL